MRTHDRHHPDVPGIDRRQPDAVRAGDADREAAAELLRTHHAAGRITDDEFQQRLEQSMAARTFGDLRALVADLPDHRPPAARARPWRRGWAGVRFLPVALLLALLWGTAARHAMWSHPAWHGYHAHHGLWFPWPLLLVAAGLFALSRRPRHSHAAGRTRWV